MGTEPQADDVIVIKKSWVTHAAVALVFFIAGGLASFFVFARGQGAAAGGTAAQAGTVAQAAAPTPPPARIDDVSLDDDPSMGNPDAPVVVVEFSDFQCPYCGRFQQDTFKQIMDTYGDDILFVYRDFPLSSIHPRAEASAEAAECADDQGAFWDYHDLLFANQTALDNDSLISYAEQLDLDVDTFTECLTSGEKADEVQADFNDGRSYGVTGTPTFFINGVRVVGAQPFASFEQVIDQELNS